MSTLYQRILVPVDGSSTADRGVTEAIAMAKLTGASVRLVHVVNEQPLAYGEDGASVAWGDMAAALQEAGRSILESARKRVAAAGVDVDTQMPEVFGRRVADVVNELAVAWRANLIVIGTHGRRGVTRLFLGSDAEQILRSAPVPVLLVRGG